MKKLTYREKLILDIMDYGVCPSSANVYAAGSRDKKPSKYARLRISQKSRTKHPEDKWGLEIKPYLAEIERAEREAKQLKKAKKESR